MNILKKNVVEFCCGVYIEETFWFPSIIGNALLCREDNVTKYIGSFPGEKYEGKKLYSDVKEYNKKLFFIPFAAYNIGIYDLVEQRFSSILLDINLEKESFCNSIIWKNYLYLFPCFYKGILRVNLDNYEIKAVTQWIDDVTEYVIDYKLAFFKTRYIVLENLVYLPFFNAHAVLEFNLESETYKIYNVGEQGYTCILNDGTKFWLTTKNGISIISWNQKKGEICQYSAFPENYLNGNFREGFYYKEHCYFFPGKSNMVLQVDICTGDIKEDTLFSDICCRPHLEDSSQRACFTYLSCGKDRIMLFSGKNSEVIFVNLLNKTIERMFWEIPKEWEAEYEEAKKKYRKKFRDSRSQIKFYCEREYYGLNGFIDNIDKVVEKEKIQKNIGKNIFLEILEL